MPRAALALATVLRPRERVVISPRVEQLVQSRLHLRATIIGAEKTLKDVDAKLLTEANRAGGTLESDDWKVTKVNSESSSISKELLLSWGVKPTIIARATKRTPYSYPRVTLKKSARMNDER